MPAQTAQYQAYSMATRTAAKTRQVVMLYDGAIRFLKQGQAAIAQKDFEGRFRLLKKASDIILGLQSSIDFDNGGEVAQTLSRFYTNISLRIMSVNIEREKGIELCDGIIGDLKPMRDIWDTIDRNLSTGATAADAGIAGGAAQSASANVTLSA